MAHYTVALPLMSAAYANNCYDETIGTTLNTAVGHEDCLYLNIWRPATNGKKLPVIVFFYGGSNVSGYTADPMYEGANLAQRTNSVVVTGNFRLGILGFINLPQLKTGTDADTQSGNFASRDNILNALKAKQPDVWYCRFDWDEQPAPWNVI